MATTRRRARCPSCPLTPARARANAIVRAVYGFSAQQQAVVWRRAKNLQVYMA